MPQRDPEARRAYSRAYYAAHRQAQIEAAKQWQKDHPERSREIHRKWYDAHGAERRAVRRDEINAYQRAWVKAHPEAQRADNRKQRMRRFGLTVEMYEQMSAAQGGVCAICKKAETHKARDGQTVTLLAVDHDHVTGLVRALLCHACNVGLGSFLDEPELLRAAADYITRFRG